MKNEDGYAIDGEETEKYVVQLKQKIKAYFENFPETDFKINDVPKDCEEDAIAYANWCVDGYEAERIFVEFEIVRKNGELIPDHLAEYIGEKIDEDLRDEIFPEIFDEDFIFEGGYDTGIYWNTEYHCYSVCWSISFDYDIIYLPY